MSNTYKLPLENTPQSFQISMAGKDYLLTCRWNDADDAGWQVDIADAQTEVAIVTNIPLVTGVDLLSGLGYLGINGRLYVYTDADPTAVPTLDNLGVESNIYFVTDVANG